MRIGSYLVHDQIGSGGHGKVYKANHENTQQTVALKVLDADVDIQRIRNEVRLQAGFSHPGITALYDLIEEDGKTILVMEYADGLTLKEYLQRKGSDLSPSICKKIFKRILEPVHYLHQRKIIHRDLKPSNIKITSEGKIKLLDFGISVGVSTPKLTREGHMVGSLKYAAPERLIGQHSIQSDIWSLGAIYFEMNTHTPLIDTEKTEEAFERIKDQKWIQQKVSAIQNEDTAHLVKKCLRVDPKKRYRDVEALAIDLERKNSKSWFKFLKR